MNDSSIENKETDATSLAQLFVDTHKDWPWHPEELKAVFRHQLTAPVQFDLAGFDHELGARLRLLTSSEGLLIQSYHDLFKHPHPPVQMLNIVKDYAKRAAAANDGIPKDIARALYYLAIITARLRCQQKISTLDDKQLACGVQWLLAQPWLDEDSHTILTQGLAMLNDQQELES